VLSTAKGGGSLQSFQSSWPTFSLKEVPRSESSRAGRTQEARRAALKRGQATWKKARRQENRDFWGVIPTAQSGNSFERKRLQEDRTLKGGVAVGGKDAGRFKGTCAVLSSRVVVASGTRSKTGEESQNVNWSGRI